MSLRQPRRWPTGHSLFSRRRPRRQRPGDLRDRMRSGRTDRPPQTDQSAPRGDGWVLAVEQDPPRAYSILAYGESAQPESPYYAQAALFARGELKELAFTEEAIQEQLIREYQPGEELRQAVRQ